MKPWMGITPPPRGQGYYPDESFPAYFTPKPMPQATFADPAYYAPYDFTEWLDRTVREHMLRFNAAVDDALEQEVAEHLRSKGWTVEPPAATKKTIEQMRAECEGIRTYIDELRKDTNA